MKAVSRKRFIPFDADAGAVIPPSNVLHEDAHGRPIHMLTRRPPYPKGVQRVPLVLHAHCSQMGLEVRGHLRRRQRKVLLVSTFEDAREKEP